jgi:branched-subunit amino acid transport protein AzlD
MINLTAIILGAITAFLLRLVPFVNMQRRPVSRTMQRYTPEREDSAE